MINLKYIFFCILLFCGHRYSLSVAFREGKIFSYKQVEEQTLSYGFFMKKQIKEASTNANPSGLAALVNYPTLIPVTQTLWKWKLQHF